MPSDEFLWHTDPVIELVSDFDQRSSKRIVIFSRDANTKIIQDVFNNFNLVDEKVDWLSMNFAKMEQKKFDIAVVVFPD